MSRQEFIKKLEIELSRLPKEEVKDIIEYYNEYFDEAGLENEEKVLKDLGSPSKIASQMKANYAVRQLESGENVNQKNKGISVAWWVILGILAAPVAFPVALACGVVAFTLFVTIWALAFSLLLVAAIMLVVGVILIVVGIGSLFTNFASSIIIIGTGLVITGLMLLIGLLIVMATKAIIRALAKSMNESRSKRAARKEMKMKMKGGKNDEN